MEPVTLNCENMRDLFDVLMSASCNGFDPQRVGFALSSRSAFFLMANYANENFQVRVNNGKYQVVNAKGQYLSFYAPVFAPACQKYISQVYFENVRCSRLSNARLCGYLKGMTSLKELNMSLVNQTSMCNTMHECKTVLTANASFSTLTGSESLLKVMQNLPEGTKFPNLTKLVLEHDSLSRLDDSWLIRRLCPALSTLHYTNSSLSQEGVEKLVTFCKIMRRTITEVVITFSDVIVRPLPFNRHMVYMWLTCDRFDKIKFHNKFIMTINVAVCLLPHSNFDVLTTPGFQHESNQQQCSEEKFGESTVIYNMYADVYV